MANVVFDYEWARRISAEHLARTLRKKMVTKALRREGAAAEYLSTAHADKIGEAVRYVDHGTGLLRIMLGEAAGHPQEPTFVRIRGIARIDPHAARHIVDAMEPLKRAIIKDSTDVFKEALAIRKLEGLPKNSAAFATVQDLISICLKSAREIVDRRVADVAAGRYRQK